MRATDLGVALRHPHGVAVCSNGYIFPPNRLRGSCFLVAESKLGVRLRSKLFDAIASQEVAFFDETDTGNITSRLTSDVTKVSDAGECKHDDTTFLCRIV